MGPPFVKAEQDRSIRVKNLAEIAMDGSRRGQAQERLVPLEAASHIAHADDRPRAPHGVRPNIDEIKARSNAAEGSSGRRLRAASTTKAIPLAKIGMTTPFTVISNRRRHTPMV